MNLFVVQLSPTGGGDDRQLARLLDELLEELPFLHGAVRTAWRAPSGRCATATAAHAPAQTAGIRYVAAEPRRVAFFSGRPFLWTDEFEADGRAPLEPEFYFEPAARWIDRIDGRWASIRYDDELGELEVASDPLGSYPVYTGGHGDVWFSNSPELIRRLAGTGEARPAVLASFFASGAAIDGTPRWDGVDRLPPGVQQFRARDASRRGPTTIDWLPLLHERFDLEVASRRLVAVVRALCDWPGRPVFLSLSGGRDSRVVLAAALAAGVDVRLRAMAIPGVPGYPATRDVRLAAALCDRAGLPLELVEPVPVLAPAEMATVLGALSPGSLSLELPVGAEFARPIPGPGEPLEIVQTGHCGEVARAYYGVVDGRTPAAAVERLVSRTMPAVPRPLLSPRGSVLYGQAVERWARRLSEAGVPSSLLVDLFYLDQRMPDWIGVSQGVGEYVRDLVNPLWSRRLIPQELGFAPRQRSHERFHLELIRALAAPLLDVPFDIDAGLRLRRDSMSAGNLRRATKLVRELRRSLWGFPGLDLLPEVAELTRAAVVRERDQTVWDVLDRNRVERLLARNPRRLDRRSRSMVWRLATVLLDRPCLPAATVEAPRREEARARRAIAAAGAGSAPAALLPTGSAAATARRSRSL